MRKINSQSQVFRDIHTLPVGDVAVQAKISLMDLIADYELVEGIRCSLRVQRAVKQKGHQHTRGDSYEHVPPTMHCE
jgi:hypothetical protein